MVVFKHAAVVFLLCVVPGLPAQTAPDASAPPPVVDVLQQALAEFRAGRFDAAVEKYQAALQRDPAAGAAYAGLARVYLKQEKVQEAFDTANKGVTAAPASLPAHTALAEVYFRQARMVEAEKEFLVGVNAAPADARACLGLSRLYEVYSMHARARKMLERAHQTDPDDPEIQRRWLYTLKIKEQIEWLEKHLASPNNDDEHRIHALRTRLDILKDRAQQPRQNCRLVSNLTSTETQLKPLLTDPKHIRGFGLTVQVNGQSSKLLLDTGAGGLLINKKLAQRAGIEPVAASKFGGIGDKGDAAGFVGYAKSIKIGDLEFQNCLVEVSEKRSIVDEDGLIGADVFSHYLVTLDFLWQKMKLEELPHRPGEAVAPAALASHEQDAAEDEEAQASGEKKKASGEAPSPAPAPSGPQDSYVAPEMKNYTKIFRFGHNLLIPTRVGDTPPKLFIIDTGATMNTISPEAAREVTKVHGDEHMHVRGISGSVKDVFSADKAVLQFSHFSQENQEMVAFDLSNISRGLGTEVSGLLGFTTLRLFTLKIDYRDGLVDFVYTGPKK